jgi:hypothetical protein
MLHYCLFHSRLQDPKNSNATKHAAAEMAIDKVKANNTPPARFEVCPIACL